MKRLTGVDESIEALGANLCTESWFMTKITTRRDALEEAARAITKHWRQIRGNTSRNNGPHWAATLVRSLKDGKQFSKK